MSNSQRESVPPPSPDPTVTDRLIRLESHVAELEKLVDELNTVVIDQGKLLRRISNQQAALSESVQAAEIERVRNTPSKPPHSVL
ncbi:MAG: SlyX family protein [Verrucomicrobia bacterium]|nr:SlyX family protein [Verrucomicrobiota bacterium]